MYIATLGAVETNQKYGIFPVKETTVLTDFEQTQKICKELMDSGVEKIGFEAFAGLTSLKTIILPSTLIEIENYAFLSCSALTSVVIPNGVTTIGISAFEKCSSLQTLVIPKSVIEIKDHAFKNCTLLKNLTLENGIKSIGVGAFSDCTNLNNVVIPESVEFIGGYAFIRCNRLHYIWCEASQKPSGWDEEWDAKVSSFEFTKVYWAKSWHYVDGVPTLSK